MDVLAEEQMETDATRNSALHKHFYKNPLSSKSIVAGFLGKSKNKDSKQKVSNTGSDIKDSKQKVSDTGLDICCRPAIRRYKLCFKFAINHDQRTRIIKYVKIILVNNIKRMFSMRGIRIH